MNNTLRNSSNGFLTLKTLASALAFALSSAWTNSQSLADAAARATPTLTDSQIAKIVRTANDGEIQQGQLAAKRSDNPEVKNFAKMMMQQHEHVNHELGEVAKEENIHPQNSSDASALKSDGDKTYASLRSLEGRAFDHAYVDAQVKAHQDVLDAIDASLLPNAKDTKLQAMLKEVRPEVADHLEHAKKLQASLSGKG